MLTLLEITNDPRTGIRRMLGRLTPPRVDSWMRGAGRTSYLRILAERREGRMDWRLISKYCLDPSMRIIMPRGENIPAEVCLRRFVPTAFLRRLRENYALSVLKSSELSPGSRSIAISGQEAEIEQLLPRLVPLVGEVRIITRRAYAIRAAAEQISEQTGLAIVVTERQDASNCNILLTPAGGATSIYTKGVNLVVSPDKPGPNSLFPDTGLWAHTMSISFSNISAQNEPLFEILYDEYSEEYDLLEFAGGLYEIAGLKELGRIIPEAALTTAGPKRPEEIVLVNNE